MWSFFRDVYNIEDCTILSLVKTALSILDRKSVNKYINY